ncbi:MAG: hypothetical protein ACKO96_22005, partial [Flammeovirgaceae bacterium]
MMVMMIANVFPTISFGAPEISYVAPGASHDAPTIPRGCLRFCALSRDFVGFISLNCVTWLFFSKFVTIGQVALF